MVVTAFALWFNGKMLRLEGSAKNNILGTEPDAVLMQFTGLHDSYGKEIYEGDILKWDERAWGCPHNEEVKWDYDLLDVRTTDWGQYCEVIGNIYESPDLITNSAIT